MKNLIIETLENLSNKLDESITTPLTKRHTKSVNAMDINPIDMPKYMKDNNIPDDAYFDGSNNGYDAYDGFLLCWDIAVPTTKIEREYYVLSTKKKRFNNSEFREVKNILTENGYVFTSVFSSKFKEFKDTTVYDMFVNKEYDRLVKYYSLRFIKE